MGRAGWHSFWRLWEWIPFLISSLSRLPMFLYLWLLPPSSKPATFFGRWFSSNLSRMATLALNLKSSKTLQPYGFFFKLRSPEDHGWRSLVGCSPWSLWELDTTEWLHFHFSLSRIGEGNGNPLQCSCLENPRDGGAWWAAIYGVEQSRTWLKRLTSSSRGPEWAKATKMFSTLIKKAEVSWHTLQHGWTLKTSC